MAGDTGLPAQSIWGQGLNNRGRILSFSFLSTEDREPLSKPGEERGPLEKNDLTLFNTFAQSLH